MQSKTFREWQTDKDRQRILAESRMMPVGNWLTENERHMIRTSTAGVRIAVSNLINYADHPDARDEVLKLMERLRDDLESAMRQIELRKR